MGHPTVINDRFMVEEALERCPANPRETIDVILAPLEVTTSYAKGTAGGPQEIILASHQIEDFDIELGYAPCANYKINTDKSIVSPIMKCNAAGQVEEGIALIRQRVKESLRAGHVPCVLGGEHTVSLAVLQAYREMSDEPITVVQMDAHGDLRSSYDGIEHSHAAVFFHVSKFYPVRQFGIRVICEEERDFLASTKQVISFPMHEMRKNKNWMSDLIKSIKTNKVYISVDVDGYDPMIMPATGTPVPGGLEWRESLEFFSRLFKEKTIVGADFVELSPLPGMHGASFLTALLVYKFIGMGMTRLESKSK